MKEADMSRCMPLTMNHGQCVASNFNRITIVQPAIRLKGFDMRKAELLRLHRHPLNPEGIFFLRPLDAQLQPFSELGGAPCVVNMAMCDQNLFQDDAPSFDLGDQMIQIAPGIDDRTPFTDLIPEQRAVLRKRGHGNDRELKCGHGVCFATWMGFRVGS